MPAPTLEDLYLLCLFILRCRLSVVSLSAQSRRFMQWMFGRRRLSYGSARPADWISLSDWNCLGTMIFSLSANRLVFVTTQSQAVDCRIRTRWISRLNLSLKLKYWKRTGKIIRPNQWTAKISGKAVHWGSSGEACTDGYILTYSRLPSFGLSVPV